MYQANPDHLDTVTPDFLAFLGAISTKQTKCSESDWTGGLGEEEVDMIYSSTLSSCQVVYLVGPHLTLPDCESASDEGDIMHNRKRYQCYMQQSATKQQITLTDL
jgi:hypothetical protein